MDGQILKKKDQKQQLFQGAVVKSIRFSPPRLVFFFLFLFCSDLLAFVDITLHRI